MDIHWSPAEGGALQNRMEIFDFAEGINEWPLNESYRNPCKDFKFLICALYVSKLSSTNYLQISDSSFVASLQVIFFLFLLWIHQYLRKHSSLHNVSNSRSLLLKFTKYISCGAKRLYMKCFDVEKLHCRVQANVLRLLVFVKRWNFSDI